MKEASAPKKGDRLYCDFCGKSQDEVTKLVAGPMVFICSECVDLCHDICHEKPLVPEPEPETPLEPAITALVALSDNLPAFIMGEASWDLRRWVIRNYKALEHHWQSQPGSITLIARLRLTAPET